MSASTAPCANPNARSRRSSPKRRFRPARRISSQLNAELAKKWPVISEMKEPPADAKQWEGVKDKLKLLER